MAIPKTLIRTLALVAGLTIIAAACSGDFGGGEPLDQAAAEERIAQLISEIEWDDRPVARKANVAPPQKELTDTLPDIDEFKLAVNPPPSSNQVVAEIFASTEKSGFPQVPAFGAEVWRLPT